MLAATFLISIDNVTDYRSIYITIMVDSNRYSKNYGTLCVVHIFTSLVLRPCLMKESKRPTSEQF